MSDDTNPKMALQTAHRAIRELHRIHGLPEPTPESYLYSAASAKCRGVLRMRGAWVEAARRSAMDIGRETGLFLPPEGGLMDIDRGRDAAAREAVAHYAGSIGLSLLDARAAIQKACNMIQRGETAHRAITAGKGTCVTLLLVRSGEHVAGGQ